MLLIEITNQTPETPGSTEIVVDMLESGIFAFLMDILCDYDAKCVLSPLELSLTPVLPVSNQ